MPQIQGVIMSQYADEACNQPCSCEEAGPRLFRCNDCFFRRPVCRSCILLNHRSNPLHRVEEWVDTHFTPSSLFKLGLPLHLGHGGSTCHLSTKAKMSPIRIVHINGVHETGYMPCNCIDAVQSPFIQLLNERLLASSTVNPRLAFTFEVLKDFHAHNLTSKKSAYDYSRAIRRKTSARLSTVPVSFSSMVQSSFVLMLP